MFQTGRASFFWKRYFYVFFPLFIFGVSHESYLIDNSLASLEDIGELVFFFCLYLFNFAVLSALVTNLWWFFLPTKQAH